VWAVGEDDWAPDERPGEAALLDQVNLRTVVKHDVRDRDAHDKARESVEEPRSVSRVFYGRRRQHDEPVDSVRAHGSDHVLSRAGEDVVGRAFCVTERADDRVASGDRVLHVVGARGVAEDERDAVVHLARLRPPADERRDLMAGRERLCDELAADTAGRSEDCEPHGRLALLLCVGGERVHRISFVVGSGGACARPMPSECQRPGCRMPSGTRGVGLHRRVPACETRPCTPPVDERTT
jgi:hypothetical protein